MGDGAVRRNYSAITGDIEVQEPITEVVVPTPQEHPWAKEGPMTWYSVT